MRSAVAFLALIFLALHLPYLPKSLEDLDSINFALGVRQFDVAHHQPHPPGYPVYIAVGKKVHAVVPDEARALGIVSVVAGALGVLAIGALFRRLDDRWTIAATAVAMTSPLYYFTAARPLSDTFGLAAAVAIQAMTLAASTARALTIAAFCAGLATGIRSQVAWLTLPLIAWRLVAGRWLLEDPTDLRPATSHQPLATSLAFLAGVTIWLVPLATLTGGPTAYWHALFDQGAEDIANIQILWTHHGARDVADALYYAFIAPWAVWRVAAIALTFAAVGAIALWRRSRASLARLTIAFAPYLIFDLLFQETFTSRYALPLVVPIAFLAVAGLGALPREAAILATLGLAMYDAHIGGTSIAAYASQKAPVFRMLDDMRAAGMSGEPPVLAPDRRQSFDLRGPLKFLGDGAPRFDRQLPALPQHEWLESVKYWNGGRRAPVWFVVDPMRTAIDLVQHGKPRRYRWTVPYPVLLGGVRPNEMDWYRVDRPEWYVGEGWALTPEAAGVATADAREPMAGPIAGSLSDRAFGGVLMIGGRNLDPTVRPQLNVIAGGRGLILEEPLMPGPFLRFVQIPRDIESRDGYARVSVSVNPRTHVAIEQFDASATRAVVGFGEGWHEHEFNPRTGQQWHWLSERGTLRYVAPNGATLHLEAESPRRYYSRASKVTVRAGTSTLLESTYADDFSFDIVLPASRQPAAVVIETDQIHVPAEQGWRKTTLDRRHLGLRVFHVEIR